MFRVVLVFHFLAPSQLIELSYSCTIPMFRVVLAFMPSQLVGFVF